jgi:hypothetical protein
MSSRGAAWVAVPLCLVNVAFALLALLFGGLNGWSPIVFLEGFILSASIEAVSVSVVGALVASYRPRNPLGWILLAVGFFQGLYQFGYEYAAYALITEPGSLPGGSLMSLLGTVTWIPALSLMLTFVPLLFPDGRLPSRRWRPVAWVSAGPLAIFVVHTAWLWPHRGRALVEHPEQVVFVVLPAATLRLLLPLMVVCGVACGISLLVRFWYSRGVERQQIKWFAYGVAVFLPVSLVIEYLITARVYYGPITGLLAVAVAPVVPVALGVAILRYRLYNIDLLINRTLVYGALTATLVAVYFGGIVLLQRVFVVLTGQKSTLAVVASTLLIAALFNPLRRRIQTFIDRRFYRSKYDARKTLEAFSAKLRNETDLDALRDDLIGVVRETMQPAHVSLWLRPDTAPQRKQTD